MNFEPATEDAVVVAELARQAALPTSLKAGDYLLTGPGAQIDTEFLLPNPRRRQGATTLITAESFSAYVNRFKGDDTLVYSDVEQRRLVAVLNDSTSKAAGWGDFRVTLAVRQTKPWQHWASRDRQLQGQVDFAEHIEAGLREIIEPSSADMLEVAQSFEVNRSVAFKGGVRLASGERQLTFVEEDSKQGTLQFPEKIRLQLQPFEGSAAFEIDARLRYRISGDGHLQLGYHLDRPDELLDQAFAAFVDSVKAATDIEPLVGAPASSR